MRLPVEDAVAPLIAALRRDRRAVLQAPPGAGKTTRVPLALREAGLAGTGPADRILMLEPRRLAARAAAGRMAETLNEEIGATIGLRMRDETRVGPETSIEVVTEAILTRMIQSDPGLEGVGLVIFDEFHERSLAADLGLAFALEVAELRDDLRLLVMSATLDAAPVATLIGAETITSEGRSFPVETIWRERPLGRAPWLGEMEALIRHAVAQSEGGVLAFLPGEREIETLASRLSDLPGDVVCHRLFGRASDAVQRAALRPEPAGQRKLVLATAIAETSLTIPDIRAVVDSGRARRARFDPASGMSRLVTEPVSRAEAAQRAGRAGRVAAGRAYRLWARTEEGALPAFAPPEIETADLAPLALELHLWGSDAETMPFLTPPPVARLAEANALLAMLKALDDTGRITPHGRALAALPLHPRLGHMLLEAGAEAAPLAALAQSRDVLNAAGADMGLRLEALRAPERFARERGLLVNRPALEAVRREVKRLTKLAPKRPPRLGLSEAEMAALAWPDRIGLRRKGEAPRFLLAGGKGAVTAPDEPLGAGRMLVAMDLDGDPSEARIRRALPFSEAALRSLFGPEIKRVQTCFWDARERRVQAREQKRFGAIALTDRIWREVPDEALRGAFLEGVRQLGLRLTAPAARLQARIEAARAAGADLPDCSDPALLASLEEWLGPWVSGLKSEADWKAFDALPALQARLGAAGERRLKALFPAHVQSPLGRNIPIHYEGDVPEIEGRVQEFFGVDTHPMAAGQAVRITLLSPAGRPVATTTDLPGFWRGGYHDMAKDMRGRYPRHPWPETPQQATPTTRTKPRG